LQLLLASSTFSTGNYFPTIPIEKAPSHLLCIQSADPDPSEQSGEFFEKNVYFYALSISHILFCGFCQLFRLFGAKTLLATYTMVMDSQNCGVQLSSSILLCNRQIRFILHSQSL
jgi:hypothetical protein